jgi:hypothetical protein
MLVLHPSTYTAFIVLAEPATKRASSSPQASLSIKRAIAQHVSDHKVRSFTYVRMIMIDDSNDLLVKIRYKWLDGGIEFVDSIPKK